MSFKPLVQIFRASGIVQTVAASGDINVKHKFWFKDEKASFANLSDEALAKSEATEAERGIRRVLRSLDVGGTFFTQNAYF